MVVLPSVPVTPTTDSSRLGSPYHQAAAEASAAGLRSTIELGSRHAGDRALDDGRDGTRGQGLRDVVVAVDVAPGNGHEHVARPDGPRVVAGSR